MKKIMNLLAIPIIMSLLLCSCGSNDIIKNEIENESDNSGQSLVSIAPEKLPTRKIDMLGNHVTDDVISQHDKTFYMKNQLLVTAVKGAVQNDIENLFATIEADVVISNIPMTDDYQIKFINDTTYEDLMLFQEKLTDSELVECVSLNFVREITLGVE